MDSNIRTMQCYPKLSPKPEPLDGGYETEMMLPVVRRLELPAPPGKEFRAPVLLAPPAHSVIQCMRPPPPPPPPPPPRVLKPPSFEEPSSSIPDLGKLFIPVLKFSRCLKTLILRFYKLCGEIQLTRMRKKIKSRIKFYAII